MSSLSVAIIGAGNIAGGYDRDRRENERGIYSHAGAYTGNGRFILQSVFDVDPERAKEFQSYWGVKTLAAGIEDIYRGFHDVVSVCSPDHTHFEIVRNLIEHQACRLVFVEKPVALNLEEIGELIRLSEASGVDVVVNFQRCYDPEHQSLRERIAAAPEKLLSVGGYYIKGLRHIGITMLDTLTFLLGYPDSVLTYHRVLNREVDDYSYEFVLFYDGFNVVVRTADADRYRYNYHIFEIDLLFSDGRITLLDNSRTVREISLGDYAYSGVNVLVDTKPVYRDTGMPDAMAGAVEYVYKVATGEIPHSVNTLTDSYGCGRLVEQIIESYEQGSIKLQMGNA